MKACTFCKPARHPTTFTHDRAQHFAATHTVLIIHSAGGHDAAKLYRTVTVCQHALHACPGALDAAQSGMLEAIEGIVISLGAGSPSKLGRVGVSRCSAQLHVHTVHVFHKLRNGDSRNYSFLIQQSYNSCPACLAALLAHSVCRRSELEGRWSSKRGMIHCAD